MSSDAGRMLLTALRDRDETIDSLPFSLEVGVDHSHMLSVIEKLASFSIVKYESCVDEASNEKCYKVNKGEKTFTEALMDRINMIDSRVTTLEKHRAEDRVWLVVGTAATMGCFAALAYLAVKGTKETLEVAKPTVEPLPRAVETGAQSSLHGGIIEGMKPVKEALPSVLSEAAWIHGGCITVGITVGACVMSLAYLVPKVLRL